MYIKVHNNSVCVCVGGGGGGGCVALLPATPVCQGVKGSQTEAVINDCLQAVRQSFDPSPQDGVG